MNNNTILKYLIVATSILLAAVAAFFSITGLAKLFAGSGTSVLIMASTLEGSKLIVVSYLYRFWEKCNMLLKIYLIAALIILMTITSMGIYGFLTAGYQSTKNQYELANTSVISYQNQKNTVDSKVLSLENNIKSLNERLTNLNTLRNNAENRVNKSFDSNRFSQSKNQTNIAKNIDADIKNVSDKIDNLENQRLVLMDSSSALNLKITQTNLENVGSTELGPIVYISQITGFSIDSVVNFLILLFILVFDPLAIILLTLYNKMVLEESIIVEENKNTIPETTIEPKSESEIEPEIKDPLQELEERIEKDLPKPEPVIEPIVQEAPKTKPKTNPLPKLYSDGR